MFFRLLCGIRKEWKTCEKTQIMNISPEELEKIEKKRKEMESLGFKEDKVYLITGMHRSGTSFVAKSLYDAGVYLGEPGALLGPNEHNPLGHYENAHFNSLSDRMLMANGGGWDKLTPRKGIMREAEINKEDISKQINDHRRKFWGWKDPRLSGTLPAFLPYFENDDVYVIACFRKPKKVVASLHKRNEMPHPRAHQLTQSYNRRLLESIREFLDL